MYKTDFIKNIEVKEKPSLLIEAANLIDHYLTWKTYKNGQMPFYDSIFFTNEDGEVEISYISDKYQDKPDYVNFIKEIRKSSKDILDEFFTDKNQDIHELSTIHRHENQREFSFLLNFLASFGIDKIEKISKDDFYFQIKMMFLFFVDETTITDYTMAGISRPMMEKKYSELDLVSLMLKTSYKNDESMALFKALYEWEGLYDRLNPLLIKLEGIIDSKFYLVEERFNEKIKYYKDSDFDFVYKLLDDVGLNDMKINKNFDTIFYINLLYPNSAAFRTIYLKPTNLELSFGLMIDEYYKEDDDEFSNSYNQDKLRAFSEPTRFEIIKLLQKKDYYVKEMADILYLTPATLSYHLNELQMTGFIGLYYQGRKSYYYLRKDTVKKLGDYLHYFADNIKEGGHNAKD